MPEIHDAPYQTMCWFGARRRLFRGEQIRQRLLRIARHGLGISRGGGLGWRSASSGAVWRICLIRLARGRIRARRARHVLRRRRIRGVFEHLYQRLFRIGIGGRRRVIRNGWRGRGAILRRRSGRGLGGGGSRRGKRRTSGQSCRQHQRRSNERDYRAAPASNIPGIREANAQPLRPHARSIAIASCRSQGRRGLKAMASWA